MKNFSSKVLTTQHEYGKLNNCIHVCFCYHHKFSVAYTGVVLMNTEEVKNDPVIIFSQCSIFDLTAKQSVPPS